MLAGPWPFSRPSPQTVLTIAFILHVDSASAAAKGGALGSRLAICKARPRVSVPVPSMKMPGQQRTHFLHHGLPFRPHAPLPIRSPTAPLAPRASAEARGAPGSISDVWCRRVAQSSLRGAGADQLANLLGSCWGSHLSPLGPGLCVGRWGAFLRGLKISFFTKMKTWAFIEAGNAAGSPRK